MLHEFMSHVEGIQILFHVVVFVPMKILTALLKTILYYLTREAEHTDKRNYLFIYKNLNKYLIDLLIL